MTTSNASNTSYRIHDLDALIVPPLGREAIGPVAARRDCRTRVAAVNLNGNAITAVVVKQGGEQGSGCLVIVDEQGRRLCRLNVFNHGTDGTGEDASGRIRLTIDVIAEEEDRGHVRALLFAQGIRHEAEAPAATAIGAIAIRQGTGREGRGPRPAAAKIRQA